MKIHDPAHLLTMAECDRMTDGDWSIRDSNLIHNLGVHVADLRREQATLIDRMVDLERVLVTLIDRRG